MTVLDLLAATTTSDTTGPFNGVSDFFSSSYFTAFEKLMVIFVVAFYLALIFWTAKDARRRIEDPVIVAVCIATAFFFPFVGVLVYLILRPPEYLPTCASASSRSRRWSAGWVPTPSAPTAATPPRPAS